MEKILTHCGLGTLMGLYYIQNAHGYEYGSEDSDEFSIQFYDEFKYLFILTVCPSFSSEFSLNFVLIIVLCCYIRWELGTLTVVILSWLRFIFISQFMTIWYHH